MGVRHMRARAERETERRGKEREMTLNRGKRKFFFFPHRWCFASTRPPKHLQLTFASKSLCRCKTPPSIASEVAALLRNTTVACVGFVAIAGFGDIFGLAASFGFGFVAGFAAVTLGVGSPAATDFGTFSGDGVVRGRGLGTGTGLSGGMLR